MLIAIGRVLCSDFSIGLTCDMIGLIGSRKDSTGVAVFARGSDARLVSLNAWQMRSIWPELEDRDGKWLDRPHWRPVQQRRSPCDPVDPL